MTRPRFRWELADVATNEELARGERFAHNAALGAGVGALREIARAEGQTYSKGAVRKDKAGTDVRWIGDRTGRELVVTVLRPDGSAQ